MNGRPRWARDRHEPVRSGGTAAGHPAAADRDAPGPGRERAPATGAGGASAGCFRAAAWHRGTCRNRASTIATDIPAGLLTASPPPAAPVRAPLLAASEAAPSEAISEETPEPPPVKAESDLSFAPAPVEQNVARGARYYQPRPSPATRSIAPEDLELMRRLQEMRDASDLILQFGPYKGSTLAQVAMSNPEYIRQLMRGAQRPEVRAAAGRLVQALDAAAEHKPTTRGSARRGRPSR